jgi:hypothetical protein
MKQAPDRKKLRREYLKKKANAYGDAAIYAIMFTPTFMLAVGCALSLVMWLIWPPEVWENRTTDLALSIIGALLCGPASWYCRKRMKESEQLAAKVPYVPPVTPDTLPADEILVRGSEEPPVVQSEVLLRAAKAGQETPQEELLRVSQE